MTGIGMKISHCGIHQIVCRSVIPYHKNKIAKLRLVAIMNHSSGGLGKYAAQAIPTDIAANRVVIACQMTDTTETTRGDRRLSLTGS